MASLYYALSCALPSTAAPVKVATGTTLKILQQVATPSTEAIRIVEWGVTLDTPATASIVAAELVSVDVAASVGTSFTPMPFNADGSLIASLCAGGAALTCFQPTTQNSPTASREYDVKLLVPPYDYVKQWPLGREPYVPVSRYLQVRVTASVTCNAYSYIIWEE